MESGTLTVTRTAGTTGHVMVDIAAFPRLPRTHYGYALVKSDHLPLAVIRGINTAPVFSDGTTATRTVAENTAANTNIGTPITATDVDNDRLTYTLSGTDAAAFSINSTTGQLRTRAALDYETKAAYSVTVAVSDGYGGSDSMSVTINVTDIHENRAPVFTDGTTATRTVAENTTANTNIGTAIAATDADNDSLTYTLGGTDAATFNIVSTTGQLKIKKTLDYETKRTYTVKITVSDGSLTDVITVTINVTDINEEVEDDGGQQPGDKGTPEQPIDTTGTPTLSVATAAPLTEATLHEGIVTLTLNGGTYEQSSFRIRNAVSVSGITGIAFDSFDTERIGDTQATIKLEYDGNLNTDSTLTITLEAGAIADYDGAALTAQIPVTAVSESVTASTAAALTEAILDESIVTLTLSGRKFERLNSTIGRAVSVSGISGVTVGTFDIDRESDTEVTVELTFNGNLNTDGTLTFTVGAGAIAGYNGPALTAQVSVSASTDARVEPDTREVPETPIETETPVEIDYDHIEGPWLWMIAPGGGIDTDNLSEASEGVITETQIAQNGVNEGDPFGELQWTSGTLLPTTVCGIFLCSSINVNNVVREIGLTDTTLNFYSAYALINIFSPHDQNDVLMGVGSDDAVKVWLNDSVVYKNNSERRTTGIQNRFRVNLNSGNNLLLVKVCDYWGDWGMFFKIYLDPADYTISLPMGDTDGQQPVSVDTTPVVDDTTPGVCQVGDVLAPGESCTYPDTDAVFSVLDNGDSKWNIPNYPWLDKISADGSMSVTVTVNDENYHFVAKSVVDNSWEIEEIGDDTPQQPDTSEQPIDTTGTPTLSVSTTSPLTEATLHEGIVTLTLNGGTYEQSSRRIRTAVSVSGITGIAFDSFDTERISDTQATIKLEYDGNLNTDSTLTITLEAGAIADYDGAALTAQMPVTAVSESVTASTASPLTAATLDESIITLTLSGRKFERWNSTIRRAVSVTGITGVTVRSSDIDRQSDTEVTVELTFNGNLNTNGTLTLTVGAGAIVGYNGPALTVQVSVSAGDAPADTGGQNPDPPETPQQPEDKDTPEQPVVTGGTPTLSVSTAAPLTEATLHGGIVTLNLSSGTYGTAFDIRRSLTVSGITGADFETFSIVRVNDTQATVELEFDGNISRNGTLTFNLRSGAIANYDGTALMAQISVPAVSESVTASTAAALTEATLDESLVTLTLSGRKFEGRNSTIRRAVSVTGITGVTVRSSDIDRISDTEVTVELTFNGNLNTDGTLTFTVGAGAIAGYNGPALTAQVSVSASEAPVDTGGQNPDPPETPQQPEDKDTPEQPVVTGGTPTITASTVSPLTEAALNGSVVTLTLSGGTYQSFWDIADAVSVSGINGVTFDDFFGIARVSDTKVTIELEYAGNIDTNGTLTFTVGAAAIVDYNGPALTARIAVSANTESVTASAASPLTEATLDESVVILTLRGAKYSSSIWDIGDAVTVSGINGVTKPWNQPERKSDTEVTVKLEFDGTDFDTTSTLTFTVGADAIAGYNGPALTTQISVTAVTESVVASTPAPLKEATLDGSTVTLTLSGAKYAGSIWDIRDGVTVSGITGVTMPWNQPDRKNDTQITIELEFDGNMNTDGTLTFTVGAEAIENYNGSALTAQVTVTADRENALLANFPNPFNPETWIPYQLAKPAEVTITIYAIDGQVVRRLMLGHQTEGIYQSRAVQRIGMARMNSVNPSRAVSISIGLPLAVFLRRGRC